MFAYTGFFNDVNRTVADDLGVTYSAKTALPGVGDFAHKILDDMDEPIIHHHHSGGVRNTNRHTRWEGEVRHEERRLRLIQEINERGAKVPRSKNRRGVDNERRVWWKDEVNNPRRARHNRNAAALAWYAEYLDDTEYQNDIRMIEDEALCPFFGEDELVYTEDVHLELDDSEDWVEDTHEDKSGYAYRAGWHTTHEDIYKGLGQERFLSIYWRKCELEHRIHELEDIIADTRREIEAIDKVLHEED